MTSLQSGQLPNRPLLLGAKAINHGLQLFALIHGDVTTEITGLGV